MSTFQEYLDEKKQKEKLRLEAGLQPRPVASSPIEGSDRYTFAAYASEKANEEKNSPYNPATPSLETELFNREGITLGGVTTAVKTGLAEDPRAKIIMLKNLAEKQGSQIDTNNISYDQQNDAILVPLITNGQSKTYALNKPGLDMQDVKDFLVQGVAMAPEALLARRGAGAAKTQFNPSTNLGKIGSETAGAMAGGAVGGVGRSLATSAVESTLPLEEINIEGYTPQSTAAKATTAGIMGAGGEMLGGGLKIVNDYVGPYVSAQLKNIVGKEPKYLQGLDNPETMQQTLLDISKDVRFDSDVRKVIGKLATDDEYLKSRVTEFGTILPGTENPKLMIGQMINDTRVQEKLAGISKTKNYEKLYNALEEQDKEIYDLANKWKTTSKVFSGTLSSKDVPEEYVGLIQRIKDEKTIIEGVKEYNTVADQVGPELQRAAERVWKKQPSEMVDVVRKLNTSVEDPKLVQAVLNESFWTKVSQQKGKRGANGIENLQSAFTFSEKDKERFSQFAQAADEAVGVKHGKQLLRQADDFSKMLNLATSGRPKTWIQQPEGVDITALVDRTGVLGYLNKLGNVIDPTSPAAMSELLTKKIDSASLLKMKRAALENDYNAYFKLFEDATKATTKSALQSFIED